MTNSRIREWRDRRGLTMQQLADKAQTTASTISKLEKGSMGLTTEWMERLAKALDISERDLLRSNPSGEERVDVVPCTPEPNDPLAALAKLTDHRLYDVISDVLADIGINSGDRILARVAPKDIKSIPPLSAVIAEHLEFTGAMDGTETARSPILILRQFVPPNKLITNSTELFQPILDLRQGLAKIVGVVVMHPRDLRPR